MKNTKEVNILKGTKEENLITAIKKTGFDMEYDIFNILKKHNWNTISNRYYIDDLNKVEREIDIVAYKCIKDENNIIYYTAIIISAKRSAQDCWVFLTRELNKNDPNLLLTPIHNVTNDERLKIMFNKDDNELGEHNKNVNDILDTNKFVFAFQQVDKDNFALRNDKYIYDSIITSIKALEYEKNEKLNKKEKVFYNFNLITIFDGEMYELNYGNEDKTIYEIDNIKYLNRHIINLKENFYMIHFIKHSKFDEYLGLYDKLYVSNNKVNKKLINNFYKDIFTDKEKVNVYWKDFNKQIRIVIEYILLKNCCKDFKIEDLDFKYEEGNLKLMIPNYFEDIEILNKSPITMGYVENMLNLFYKYKGKFEFVESELPF